MDRATNGATNGGTDGAFGSAREPLLAGLPADNLKFKALYLRDLATGIGLLEDGTLVRFIYEGPRGSGNNFTMRVYQVDVKDERGMSASMFKPE